MPPGIGYGNRRRRTQRPGLPQAQGPHSARSQMQQRMQGVGTVPGTLRARTPALSGEELIQRGANPYEVDLRPPGTYTPPPVSPYGLRLPLPFGTSTPPLVSSAEHPAVQQAVQDSDRSIAAMDEQRRRFLAPGRTGYSTQGVPRGVLPETQDLAASALSGNVALPRPNEGDPMLTPMLPAGRLGGLPEDRPPTLQDEIRSGALQERMPEGASFGGGSTVAYRDDGRPVLLPPRTTRDDYLLQELPGDLPQIGGGLERRAQAARVRAVGDRAGLDRPRVFRGSYALSDDNRNVSGEELRRRRQQSIEQREATRPLAGFPRLPGRMSDADVAQSRNQRRGARGLPPLGGVSGEEGAGIGGRQNLTRGAENYVDPETGAVNRTAMVADAVSGLMDFDGGFDEARALLENEGMTWADARSYAMEELYPKVWDQKIAFTKPQQERWRERRRKYERLRELDPSLPEWELPGPDWIDPTKGWDEGQTQQPTLPQRSRGLSRNPPRELTEEERQRLFGQ